MQIAPGETKAETASRDVRDAAVTVSTTLNATGLTTTPFASDSKKVYSAAEKNACSIEAMKNGEACEACQ